MNVPLGLQTARDLGFMIPVFTRMSNGRIGLYFVDTELINRRWF